MVRVKNYIHANYSDANLSLEMAADMIGSSGSSVSRRFKTAYGCNFLNYVTEYRISKAKEMLESTDIAIQEVGLLTGFPSMPTFFRVFKKSVGVSPGQYRMNHQNQTQDLPHQI